MNVKNLADSIKSKFSNNGDSKEGAVSINKKALEVVDSVKKDLAKYRQPMEKGWNKEEKAYYGDIWENSAEYKPYENTVFQIVESEVPILTDAMSAPVAKTNDPEFAEQVENLTKSIDWVLKNQNFGLIHPIVSRKSLISAPGFIYPYYDPNSMNGDGQIRLEVVPWKNVYIYSRTGFLEDSQKARIELERSKDELMLAYPGKQDEIEKLKGTEAMDDNDPQRGREQHDTGGRYSRKVPHAYSDSETVKLIVTYKKDYSVIAIPDEETIAELEEESQTKSPDVTKWQNHKAHKEAHSMERGQLCEMIGLPPEAPVEMIQQTVEQLLQENPEGEFAEIPFKIQILDNHIEAHTLLERENPKNGKLKYPAGWRVIESVEKTILYDGPNKYDHGQINLIPFYCYQDGTTYGFSEVRNILDSQYMQAVMTHNSYKGLQRVGNPAKAVAISSGLTPDDITNEPGAIYLVEDPVNDIRDLAPGVISEQVLRFGDDRINKMRDISGMVEATQGKMPSPNASGVTVDKIQQQAIGRVRLKTRINDHYSIKRLGCQIASMILQFWTSEKTLAMEGDKNSYEQIIFNPMDMKDIAYEVDISAGSMVGVDKNSYNALLTRFMETNQLTLKQLLQVGEFPKSEKLLSLLNENENEQIEEMQGQMEQIQMEYIKLKGSVDPELLSPEEKQMFDQIQREEKLQELTAVNDDQAEQ